MTSFSFILAYVTLSTRVIPSLYLLVPFQAPSHSPFPPSLSLSLSLSFSLVYLPRSLRLSTPSCLGYFTPSCPSRCPNSFPGPLRRYAADGNPRCPPTDTNGYLCQRRNLLLYIPLYKQRVNRAPHPTCAAYGGPGPSVSLSSSAASAERIPDTRTPWKPIYRSFIRREPSSRS